ncbi:peroxiredoxin [Aureimonas endophytica]|uniref:Glutathione-dependent peroxiredoxin n=1 Tax=Aureimonas endophytica TaxID=2027858 RepID=A0A916ZW31_9HYPH|nr:peroxiredoxin [Aureimonas endophytica]GGE14307.1 peroxiredoxin [Aureimonas endophytica]
MTISIGDRIPSATLKTPSPDGPRNISTDEIFSGRKVVLFGVPGAFTPTCSMNHLPGFLDQNEAIRAKGVGEIAVLAVNDHHVMAAWEKATGGQGKILYLADGNGDFVKALGLDVDLSVAGLGTRSKRFAAIVEDGVLTLLNVEEAPGQPTGSSAEAILAAL